MRPTDQERQVGETKEHATLVAVAAINRRTLLTTLAAAGLYRGNAFAQAPGPLPSWSDRTRQSIVDFVGRVTREGGPDYVAPAERIATFDNDGTLWCEKPLPVQRPDQGDGAAALGMEGKAAIQGGA